MADWKGAHPPRQTPSPQINPNGAPTSRSVNWKGGNAEDTTLKPSPNAPIPGRINLPKAGGDD